MSKQAGTKRNIFAELMEGVDAMGAHRAGKVTLRTHSLPEAEVKESPGAEFFVAVREKFNVSLAATFVELVSRSPDTIERLQTLPKRVARLSKTPSAGPEAIAVERPAGGRRDAKANAVSL